MWLQRLPIFCIQRTYANRIHEDLSKMGVKVSILDESQLKALGCEAILAVGAGSEKESRMVVLEYSNGSPDQKPVAFVGKGVTFDTGGISIKPSKAMDDMKYDMGGFWCCVRIIQSFGRKKS